MILQQNQFEIKLDQFEGPFDLLLFFIERDELDIMNIPISRITNDFLNFIHEAESMNIELAGEFILVASTLMRIKAKMLLPRVEKDEQGNEIDPRADLVSKLLEYKQFKEATEQFRQLETDREKMVGRGNIARELTKITLFADGSNYNAELKNLTLFRLMTTFEKVMERFKHQEDLKHTIVEYPFTLEEEQTRVADLVKLKGKVSFDDMFEHCRTRIHAVYVFLSILDLIQARLVVLLMSEGFNNFYLCYPETGMLHAEGNQEPS
ncbi:MAG: segregation/condensation protein A [Bacteroidia bacterium]|nr:segregation/condensation protein A [Bacteroidia bacterium]MCZ2276670.1 segregation/condensation protein A [Bacteroidia bacterium]